MSWMKRTQPGAPAAQGDEHVDQPPYGAAQHSFENQQNMFQNYPGNAPATTNPQQQYWQMQAPSQYSQQYGQASPQQNFGGHNANQFYQQYNQSYGNQPLPHAQPVYQQNFPHFNQNQPTYAQGTQNKDGWEDNWDWSWDENAKQAQKSHALNQATPQQQNFNNANLIEESFTTSDTWNWSMENRKAAKEALTPSAGLAQADNINNRLFPDQAVVTENNVTSEPTLPQQTTTTNQSTQPSALEESNVRTLNDREVVKERMPNLALGKRFHLDNLTPQWSIESQMSQESSDGQHTHTESTYRSDQSRNSNKSSPGLNTDNSNFNYLPSGLEEISPQNAEWSGNSVDEPTAPFSDPHKPQTSHEDVSDISVPFQQMNLSNQEHLPPNLAQVSDDVLPVNVQDLIPPSSSPGIAHMLPSASPVSLPPPTSNVQNSFKNSGPFSHMGTKPFSAMNKLPHQVNKTAMCYPTANLETTPDNSERPDQPQQSSFRSMAAPQPMPENLEVAPRNDRNEYLQTAHLSSPDYGENTDFSRNAPPPGLRRMVVGQQESEYGQGLNLSADEPLPAFARMVPGQQNEVDNAYSQPTDGYSRHVDGQTTDLGRNPYRSNERRPIGLDRLVPGESSNEDYRSQQYQGAGYGASAEHRVVTGVDHDYVQMSHDANPSDIREQNVDGSDYMAPRNVIGAREVTPDVAAPASEPDRQREVTGDGENLQDLSIVTSVDMSFSRDQPLDGADLTVDMSTDRKTDASGSIDLPTTSSRRQSLNRVNTSGEDSERDRAFKASPRRDRDKHKPPRDRDPRYSRDDRKYDRDPDRRPARDRDDRERRSDKDKRDRYKDEYGSPDDRRYRHGTKSRKYETEDTDYYSDRERERRRYREGSYTSSKPPRPDDKDRRYADDRDRSRRYATIERERRYALDPDRDGTTRGRWSDRDRDRDVDKKYDDRRYRDIDPGRKYGHREQRRRGGGGESRADSREREPTEDELHDSEPRRRHERARRHRRDNRDNRYERYYDGYGDPYELQLRQQQTYQYYEHLRLTNPAAYMEVYKKVMAGEQLPPAVPLVGGGAGGVEAPVAGAFYMEGYGSLGYETRREERGGVHSGRSSATGKDTDLPTDASLSLQLDEWPTRSERLTPYKFATAHVKASVSSRHLVVVRPTYPSSVQVLPLDAALAADPLARELGAYPGPLLAGVVHKKSVIEYCAKRIRGAERHAGTDLAGYVLVWELLALLLRQNGMVVGSDVAELLMKNEREHAHQSRASALAHNGNDSRRDSAVSSGASRSEPRDESEGSRDQRPPAPAPAPVEEEEEEERPGTLTSTARARLDKLREYLTYGNRQQALEWAMANELWGHALHLASWSDRRTRASVVARFMAAQPPSDPLHTLYAALAGRQPPVATCAADERWGDWRPHLAMLLANLSAKPDADKRSVVQLGDSLASRGQLYSSQFCYLAAEVDFGRHPLAPLAPSRATDVPRLALLLATPHAARLEQLATNQAIFATEIYEFARSLHDPNYAIAEFQVYKLMIASRLTDCGQYGRALGYAESAARALSLRPDFYSARFVSQVAELAHRLKYHEPALHEEPPPGDDAADLSPRHHRWLDDITALAHTLTTEACPDPASVPAAPPPHATQPSEFAAYQYDWTPTQSEYQQQPPPPPPPALLPQSVATDHPLGYGGHYYAHNAEEASQQFGGQTEWAAHGDAAPAHHPYYEAGAGAGAGADDGSGALESEAETPRPQITMPGASTSRPALFADYEPAHPAAAAKTQERDHPDARSKQEDSSRGKEEGGAGKGGGWLGGILTKLALRPPNQMILPDDKNPTIVWDAERKRWRNLDADEGDDEGDATPPPPPRAPTAGMGMAPAPGVSPAAQPTSNIFKMQKGRHIKKCYVDVFNPGGAPGRPLPPASEVLGSPLHAPGAPPAYFVPSAAAPDQVTQVQLEDDEPPLPPPPPPPLPTEDGALEGSQLPMEEYRSGI